MNGFLWTLLTRKKTKKHKNNLIKNKIERANTELNRESQKTGSTKPQSQIRMFSRRKKTILSFTLSLFYLFVAPVIQVLPVYSAEPAAAITVWDVILTELVGSNAIITDTAVLSAYSSVLGNMAASTANAGAINTALATAASSCGVELAPIFANTVESAASVGVTAVAATAGENIAATSIAAASIPSAAVIPALGGAVVAGVGLGVLYNHVCKQVGNLFAPVIRFGNSIKNASVLANNPPPSTSGYGGIVTLKDSLGAITSMYNPAFIVSKGGRNYLGFYNPSDTQFYSYVSYQSGGYSWSYNGRVSAKELSTAFTVNDAQGPTISYEAAYDSLHGGQPYNLPLNYCPDLSSINGLIKWDPEADPDIIVPNIPELQPLPEYETGYGLKPIPEADYQDIVTYINGRPDPDTFEKQEEQEQEFPTVINPIIDPYFVPIGDPSPGPGTDPQPTGTPDPQPTGSPNPNPNPKPDTQPFPDPETVPQPTPVINPTPDSEVAPAPVPYPDPATPSDQDKTDTDTKITPIDLRDKFPFCIPFDILKIMKLFQGGREAPCFTWEIPFGAAGSGSVTVDLSAWDSAAALLRTLELILFIMLLAVGTRNLIGGSS